MAASRCLHHGPQLQSLPSPRTSPPAQRRSPCGSPTRAGDPKSWSWSFGDGGTSDQQHPTHAYTAPGNYTVALSVDDGLSTATKPDSIKVTPVLFGDANGDGEVNQADTLRVLQQVVGIVEPDKMPKPGTEEFQRTDVNQNGVIEVGDALFIAQYNVGLRDVWFELLE
jgi:hypothetical protein